MLITRLHGLSAHSFDYLEIILNLDEVILEKMVGIDKPWEDMHHRSYFLLDLRIIENGKFHVRLAGDV